MANGTNGRIADNLLPFSFSLSLCLPDFLSLSPPPPSLSASLSLLSEIELPELTSAFF